jgi:Dimerisation domain
MLSPERILEIGGGFRGSQILLTALELGVFTELGKGPRSYSQLQRTLGLDEDKAQGFLDSLVALGLLSGEGSGVESIYINTRESSHFLDSNSPAYIGPELTAASVHLAPLWKPLLESLRTARAASRR